MTAAGKRRIAAAAIGLLTAVPVGVGFIVSWGAQRDAALAAHVAPSAAKLYPVGVDGLITVALVSALVLRHNRGARRYSIAVLVAFSASSLALNIAHGAGAFVPGAEPGPLLTALVTAQPVAAIAFGSHLLVHVLRVWFPALAADAGNRGNSGTSSAVRRSAAKSALPDRMSAGPASQVSALGTEADTEANMSTDHPSGGNAAVIRLPRHSAAAGTVPPVPVGTPGSKTAAIRNYREKFLADNGREPNAKETATATGASERMARKVLGQLRDADGTELLKAAREEGAV